MSARMTTRPWRDLGLGRTAVLGVSVGSVGEARAAEAAGADHPA